MAIQLKNKNSFIKTLNPIKSRNLVFKPSKPGAQMRHIDIATEYAKGWNNLNFTNFFECLDADCELSSYWVLSNLKGKLAIADYLNKKVETIKRANHKVYAELGTCTVTEVGSPCVVLAQSDPANHEGVVTFKINSNLVTEMNICAFQILAPNCSGIYPK